MNVKLTANLGRWLGTATIAVLVIAGAYFSSASRSSSGASRRSTGGSARQSQPATASPPAALAVAATPTIGESHPATVSASRVADLATPTTAEPRLATPAFLPTSAQLPTPAPRPVLAQLPTATMPAGVRQAVQVLLAPGVLPSEVAERIVGPGAVVQRAPQGGAVPPPQVADRLGRTWLVPVAPGTEQAALARAQGDPGVESAQLVRWPPLVLHPE